MTRAGAGAVMLAVLTLLPAPASAQSTWDIELGGGALVRLHDDTDLLRTDLPRAGLTVDLAGVRWLNDRWGVAGQFTTMIIGSTVSGRGLRMIEEDRFTLAHLMVRYRRRFASGRALHVGAGSAGVQISRERGPRADGVEVRATVWPAFEMLGSEPLTDTVDLRYGFQLFPVVAIRPVVTVAWTFGQR